MIIDNQLSQPAFEHVAATGYEIGGVSTHRETRLSDHMLAVLRWLALKRAFF